jgi:hypothetical protein
MIKPLILVVLFGLATCNPINLAKINYANDLTKISEKFDQKAIPTIAGLDANTLLQVVDMFPGDWTLNEIIIVAAQTVFGEILDMQPVPEWFDGYRLKNIILILQLILTLI